MQGQDGGHERCVMRIIISRDIFTDALWDSTDALLVAACTICFWPAQKSDLTDLHLGVPCLQKMEIWRIWHQIVQNMVVQYSHPLAGEGGVKRCRHLTNAMQLQSCKHVVQRCAVLASQGGAPVSLSQFILLEPPRALFPLETIKGSC